MQPLTVQYGDYAVWEQAFRASAGHQRSSTTGRRRWGNPGRALDLPYAKPRPKWQSFKGADPVRTPDRLVRDRPAAGRGRDPFMVGLAAFQTVLHRSTGLGTLVLGTPVANRGCAGVEPLVGLFVNTLVLRTDVGGVGDSPTFHELLDRVRETRAGAFANQDVSLEAVIEAVRPPRDPSRQPLFQAAYYYQNVTIVPDRCPLRLGALTTGPRCLLCPVPGQWFLDVPLHRPLDVRQI